MFLSFYICLGCLFKLSFELAFANVEIIALFWVLFHNNFVPSKKISLLKICPTLVLNVVVLIQLYVLVLINTDDLKSPLNRTNMNVQIQQEIQFT